MTAPAFKGRLGLTARQRECFGFIERHIALFKQSPSMEELRVMMNLSSKSPILHILKALEERGWITMMPRKARSIAIIPDVNGYVLPPAIDAQLRAHCAATGEEPGDVLADAVTLFFDEAEGSAAA